MRQLLLTIILFFLFSDCFSQDNTKKINQLIDSLSWNSISMDCMGGALVLTHQDKTEQALLKIGKEATNFLISALSDKTKTVIVHIILSQMWETERQQNLLGTKYVYKNCDESIGWHHIYNGLVWEWYEKSSFTIEQKEIDKIKKYWNSKLVDKVSTDNFNIQKIYVELTKQDNDKFPCNKNYDNNSASVKSDELFKLLLKKEGDPEFQKLWILFGNDSAIKPFNDCFFITYQAEGLSFRFKKDSTLSTIFIEPSYEGELPYNIRMSDTKTEIEKKIGLPDISNYPQGWSYYTAKCLYFYFGETDKIEQFLISKKNDSR